MKIYTIGFTGKKAESFFTTLKNSGAKRLIDIRINRNSQLAGFTKEQDLGYFLSNLANIEYQINSDLAPTKELLGRYRKKDITWDAYSMEYISLIKTRNIIDTLGIEYFVDSVFMCSEKEPEMCHRKLLTDLLLNHFTGIRIEHL
jgi:uncharacterized protein (DUF488 family)